MRPSGNLYGSPTYANKRLSQEDYIVFETGTCPDAIKLSYRAYEKIVNPRVEDLAIKARSHPASLTLQVEKIRVQSWCGPPPY